MKQGLKFFSSWSAKVFSFLLAVAVVLIVEFSNISNRVVTIPLSVALPDGLVAESLVPETVDIVISGSEQLIYLVDPSSINAYADFSDVDNSGEDDTIFFAFVHGLGRYFVVGPFCTWSTHVGVDRGAGRAFVALSVAIAGIGIIYFDDSPYAGRSHHYFGYAADVAGNHAVGNVVPGREYARYLASPVVYSAGSVVYRGGA